MNNKKGISDVVTTVLIVLLSLVAITIVWSFLSPLISKSGTQVAQTQACLSANLEVAKCSSADGSTYGVTVSRGAGSAEGLTKVKLIFTNSDGSGATKAFEQDSAPGELETLPYSVLTGFSASDVVVSAGIADAKGNVEYCTPSQPTSCNIA